MDVGSDNFRFTLDDPEKKATSTRQPKTAELHLDSLDRYTLADVPVVAAQVAGPDQNTAKYFGPVFAPITESATNNCLIQTKRNLLYGYFSRVALTQFNLNYNVPTVITGYNDQFALAIGAGAGTLYTYTIPQGYYTPTVLAATIQTLVRATPTNPLPGFTVTAPTNQRTSAPTSIQIGFLIASGDTTLIQFVPGTPSQNGTTANNYGRTWRLLGVNSQTQANVLTLGVPNFRPTDYVDIVSNSLTNYKDTKDANSSIQSPGSVLGRVWLNESGINNQATGNGYGDPNLLGVSPLTITKNWYNANWSQWSPNQAINSVDITLLDMWGNPLFWSPTYPTEWSATLTVTE
jgi:hypothetical protein